jgi:hypothetical protein
MAATGRPYIMDAIQTSSKAVGGNTSLLGAATARLERNASPATISAIQKLKEQYRLTDDTEIALRLLDPKQIFALFPSDSSMQMQLLAAPDKNACLRQAIAALDPTVDPMVGALASPGSNSEPLAQMGPWMCGMCGSENQGTSGTCGVCKAPRTDISASDASAKPAVSVVDPLLSKAAANAKMALAGAAAKAAALVGIGLGAGLSSVPKGPCLGRSAKASAPPPKATVRHMQRTAMNKRTHRKSVTTRLLPRLLPPQALLRIWGSKKRKCGKAVRTIRKRRRANADTSVK